MTEDSPTTYALPETAVEPACSANVVLRTPAEKGSFRATSIEIPPDVAPYFVITDIKVGLNSQLVSTACLPASFFGPPDPKDDLYFELLPTIRQFTISVTNTSPQKQKFTGTISGAHSYNRLSSHNRNTVIGLGLNRIDPGKSLSLKIQPQLAGFSPSRLFLPPTIAATIIISGLSKIPISNENISRPRYSDPDPTSSSLPDSIGKQNLISGGYGIELYPSPIVHYNEFIKIVATNPSDSPINFSGAIVGRQYR